MLSCRFWQCIIWCIILMRRNFSLIAVDTGVGVAAMLVIHRALVSG